MIDTRDDEVLVNGDVDEDINDVVTTVENGVVVVSGRVGVRTMGVSPVGGGTFRVGLSVGYNVVMHAARYEREKESKISRPAWTGWSR